MDVISFDGEKIPVEIIYSPKRRTIGLSVKSRGEVVVRAPAYAGHDEIMAIVQEKAAWIAKHRQRILSRPVVVRQYADGDTISFMGRELTIRRVAGPALRAGFDGSFLNLMVPPLPDDDISSACRDVVSLLYQRAGVPALSGIVERYAKAAGVATPALRVRQQKEKWGCCTPKNGIIINARVLLAPRFVVEYLVVHEISHLRFRHHQQSFWDEVERLMPEFRAAERMLKECGHEWVF